MDNVAWNASTYYYNVLGLNKDGKNHDSGMNGSDFSSLHNYYTTDIDVN